MAKPDFMALLKQKTEHLPSSLLLAEADIKRQIVILEQLRDLISSPTDEELSQLAENVLSHGVKDPLTIWETTRVIAGIDQSDAPAFVLIDGHNRYRLIAQHGLDFRLNLVKFPSLEAVKDYMIKYQLGRRNLTAEQASYLRGMRYLQQKAVKGSNLQASGPQRNVAAALAKEYGVSDRTIKRDGDYATGLQKLSPELKQDVLAGRRKLPKTTVNAISRSAGDELTDADALALPDADSSPGLSDEQKALALKTQIRALANGQLSRRECTKLLKKAGELVQLLSSK